MLELTEYVVGLALSVILVIETDIRVPLIGSTLTQLASRVNLSLTRSPSTKGTRTCCAEQLPSHGTPGGGEKES